MFAEKIAYMLIYYIARHNDYHYPNSPMNKNSSMKEILNFQYNTGINTWVWFSD